MPPSYRNSTRSPEPRSSISSMRRPRGQERRLAHALGERLEVELDLLEDLEVGQEGDRRAGLVASPRPSSAVACGTPRS